MEQGQNFKGLVHSAETAGKYCERVRRSRHGDLSSEEILHRHEHGFGVDVGVGELLERQFDVHAERVLSPGTFRRGFHDPGSGARNDHPTAFGHRGPERTRHLVERVLDVRARRPEHGQFGDVAPLREQRRRLGQLIESLHGHAQIAEVVVNLREFHEANEQRAKDLDALIRERGVATQLVKEPFDQLIHGYSV